MTAMATRRTAKRTRGRPFRLLEPGVKEKLIEATRLGVPIYAAAAHAGISDRSFQIWLARGRDEEERLAADPDADVNPDEEEFLLLWRAIRDARAAAHVRNVGLVQKAAAGGYVTKTRTRSYRDAASGQVVTEVEEDRAGPDWRAASWYLERAHPQEWGKAAAEHRVELTGANGGPVQVEQVDADALADKVTANMEAMLAAVAIPALPAGGDAPVDAEIVEED